MAVCVPESELSDLVGFTVQEIKVPEVCLRGIRLVWLYKAKSKDVQRERPSFFW